MAERNIDPGGGEEGGGSVEPHDNQSPRNGEKGSDQRGDVGARTPEVGFSVPEASVKLEKEGGMKKAPNETKSDSPLSHQVSLEQCEAKQKPQPVAQKWTVPLSRFITKRIPKTSSTQDSVQPSPRRNRRSEKKKRYIQNKKKRKELEVRQHQDDQSKNSVKGDIPPASDNEMEFDDAQQEQEETSHNTAFSSESQDQEEQTSKNDTLQCETAVMVRSDSSHVVQDSRPPLETKGENKIPSTATSGPEGIHCDIQGGSVPPLEPVGASETQGEPKSKPAEVSTSIPVFGNNDTLQSVTAVLVPSDNCHVVQDSRPPLETKGENKAPSIATSGPEGNHRDIQGSSMPPLEPIGASETQVDNQWQRCDERSSEIVNVEAYTMETSGHPGDGSIEMGGDELPRGSKVSEYEATRGSVVKEVEASSKKKGDKAVGALKVKGGEFAVGSKEKESEYDSPETHFKQTGWKGNDSGSEVADGLKEERVKATDGPKKKGNEDVGQNAGGLKVKEHEAAGGSMKQRDGSNEKGDDSGQADRGTKETGDVDGGQTGGGLKWKGDEDGGKAASGLTEKEDIAGLNESEDEADLKEKRDKFIDGSKTKGDEDVGQDAGGLEEGEHEAAGGSIKQRDSLKEKRGDSGQAGGGTKEKGDEDGGQTGGGLKGKAHKDGGGSARGLTKKDDVAAVGSKKTGDEAAGGLKKGNQSDCGSNEKGDGCGRGLKKVHESAGTSKEKDQSAHSLKEKGDQAAGGSKEKGNDAAVGSKKKKDQAEIGLKVKVDEVGDVSKEKGHQANSGLKDKEDEVSDGAKKKDEATGGSKEKRRQADSGLKEKGDKTAGGSKKKEDQAESGLKVKVDEVGDGSKEKGHQANSGLKDKEDEVSDGAKKKDEATGGSKEKRRQADSGLKEKGDKTAGGSGRRIDAGNAGCVKDGDAVRSLNSSENVGSGSDWWDSSSKEARAENTMVIVLHAFIQPDAWSIDSKDLQHAIHVYSEHLEWKQNCAKVNVRQCDKLTWSVEAHLQLPKAWERKSLQYKYYVCASKQPSDDNYEHLAHSGGGIHNRCLVPNRNYHYDARDHCYHHFDDFICPTRPPDSWTGKLKKFLGFKDVNDLKPQSLLEHLHCYSNNPTPTIRAVLCQDVSAAVEDITHKFSEVYGSYSCSRTGQPRLNQNNKVLSAFKEWMTSMVHSLYTLAGKSSSNIEVVELQLAGCVLVTVLARLGWLDARGTLDKLGIDILIELMNLLKLPLTNPTLIQQWCTDFRGRITPEIRTELVPSLQMFWVHMARRDRLHFDVIPLILEVSGKSVPDDVFHEIGFKQSTFLSSFPVTNIKKFKTSIAECSALCLSFPAIVTLVLHGIPVKHWHELDIADHMPNDQYLALALTTKMKQLSDADQVKYAGSIGQFLVTLLVNTNGLQFCTFTKDQLKTLQTSWCTITPSWLRKSKVPLDMKVVVLRMCFCVLTQVKLNLNVAEFKDVLISMREAVNEGIKNVILSRPYDMKRDDLLGFGINVTEELKVWNCMLSDDVFVAAEVCQDAWTDICCQAIKQRVDPLTLQAKFDSLEKLEKILHHVEVLEKILLDSAMEAFNSELHDDERAQYFHGNVSSQMSIILNKFLTKKYEDITAINFEELCTWSLWPSYFRLWRGKDASEAIAEKDECFAYVQGSQLLDSVITSITNEEVNVECIKTITRHRKNFEELVKCCYGQPNDVDYILQRTQLLASIIAQFEEMRRSLLFLSRECLTVLSANRETRGELISIQNLCRKGIQTCPVIRLQEHFSDHPVVERLHPILSSFCQIFDTFRSDITSKLWMQVCEQDVTSIQDLVERVWPIFIGTLQKMVVSLSQLTVPCGEAEFLMPTGTAPQQLRNVVKALMACQLTGRVNINVDEISSKVRLYDGLKVVSKQAEQLLRVVRNFGLEGDFTVVVNIANIPSRLAEQPISVLDRGYAEVAEFLNEYSVLHASLEELSSSQELIEWLKTAMKDVHQLQTFTNIALMTQCTDGYIVDLLTSLDQVVMKLAPLIFDLQRHDDLKNFMKHCCALRREHLSAIPEKVQMCRDKLMWYKTIQSTMGSVEETAFGQLKEITQHGVYVIHVGDGIPKDIKGLVKVHILKQRSAKHEYTLDELKDLQSKLALIKGKMTEKDIKVVADRFWQALELTVRIASTLLELLLMGHVKYRKFEYSLCSDEVIGNLQELARQMESDLENWRTTIEELRFKYYHMNYFTTRQLSLICRELSELQTITRITFKPSFLDLIHSVCHTVDHDRLATAAVRIMEERNRLRKSSLIGHVSGDALSVEDLNEDEAQNAMTDSESLQRMYSVQPLKVDDLNRTQLKWLEELREYDFTDELILTALSAKGCTFQELFEYCVKFSSSDVDPGSELPCVVEAAVQDDRPSFLPLNENHPLVKDMVESGFDLELAIEAADVCKGDQEQMLHYCLEHERVSIGSEGIVSRNQMQQESEHDVEVPHTLPQTVTVNVAEEDLWSLENVGQFLQCVAEQHAEDIHHFLPSARAFSHFQIGAPNLIVVPRDQLLRTVLSVYMPAHDLPLPTCEEVLFCDSMTTSEEIRLLLRRAACDPDSRRICCLVCEHNLSYKCAKKAVQDLRELVQGKTGFRLVIICCKEDEVSSLLVGDLREYKQNPPPLPQMKSVQDYLRNHLANDALGAGEDLDITGTSTSVDPIANQSYVRIVTSKRAGMGKSLYISRKVEELDCALMSHNRIRSATLHGPELSRDNAVKVLRIASSKETDNYPYIYHLEVSDRVLDDIGSILFSMMILRGLQDSEGNIWRCKLKNVHLIEVTVPETGPSSAKLQHWSNSKDLIHLLPTTRCLSPYECLHEQSPTTDEVVRMDEKERLSEPYQRVFQYLYRYHYNMSVDEFTYHSANTEGNETDCIQLLLEFFELPDPSWAELHYFVKFLNTQLMACEYSVYCDEAMISDRSQGVYGFKSFVVKFMIRMAVDFTVPSLQSAYRNQMVSERTAIVQAVQAPDIEEYQVVQRRAWEKNVHPYIFFNRDASNVRDVYYDSMTFVGFNFQQVGKIVNLIDLQMYTIEENIMTAGLYRWMRESGVESRQDPNTWTKVEILKKLHRVLESSTLDPDDFYFEMIDPDPSYALTFDNLVKMLAIQMRFRCNIPVVIMGETGCGKTRLVRYMCQLQSRLNMDPSVPGEPPQNFFIMKVHGGVTEEEITQFVSRVQKVAIKNQKSNLDTVMFFDEANTSDAIELIKEIMCDRRLNGETIQEGVKFIAACNPYKRHSDDMIEKLESAGLGFFIKGEETKQKLGSTPLRHLVYRVLDLPASMKPLVYDYGSLCTATEQTYIHRIVENHVERNNQLRGIHNLTEALTQILSWCQDYMRKRKDECSYVSLRDVERFMIVFEWFHNMHRVLSAEMDKVNTTDEPIPNPYTLALILSLVVCYYTRLLDRCEFEHQLVQHLVAPLQLPNGRDTFCDVVQCCQKAFLENMKLGENIAHNAALRENVFMMTVCVELRIPLFVVGKPGSSKSLAKSIIAESMKGQNSKNDFLKNFKTVKLISYQCSQLSTPESIMDVFRNARQIQDGLDYRTAVALVVLDEVGLAEDSPTFPLKALHPLLEDGTDGSDKTGQIVEQEKRVAFIGISNWALDPAKMNRGIMVMRGEPSIDELVKSARGICSNLVEDPVRDYLDPIMKPLAEAYLRILRQQEGKRKEFFGLRDFYSLIKMLYWLIWNNCDTDHATEFYLTVSQLTLAVRRNFGGSDEFDPLCEFHDCLQSDTLMEDDADTEADDSPLDLIKASLRNTERSMHGENRYLLFLTENDAALEIMHRFLFQREDTQPHVLFGSSFPKDKDYTQVCRNINQIKICMEAGRTVVLLNLDNLYESLYDLLNQYYTKMGQTRYVDLGLQTHRIKCRVHDDFKLILIAEKDKVYDKFPIPLINRLEKHLVTTSTILLPDQQKVLRRLEQWIDGFTEVQGFKKGDAFIGFQSQTPATVVLQASQHLSEALHDSWLDDVINTCKELLVQMACPDALARLKLTPLGRDDAEEIWDMYFTKQMHLGLDRLILKQLQTPPLDDKTMGIQLQVTTHSRPLAPVDVFWLCRQLNISNKSVEHMYLEELDAEADFTDRIRKHISTVKEGDAYILVQCSSGHLNKEIISCARHKAIDELENFRQRDEWEVEYARSNRRIHVIFIVSLPKLPGGTRFAAFQGGKWLCVHLDDLRSPEANALTFMAAVQHPISKLFYPGCRDIALHRRLRNCIQAAVSQIPEALRQPSRKVQLLDTLLGAIPEHMEVLEGSFYGILVRKLKLIIVQKEEIHTEEGWAIAEALNPHSLHEGGTYLNTLLRRIDDDLTSYLSYTVEYVDQWNNLNLYEDENLQQYWLEIFDNDDICKLDYAAIKRKRNDEVPDVLQTTANVGAMPLACNFPFSWLFLSAMEDQFTSSVDSFSACVEKMNAQYVGKFLSENTIEAALLDLYLKDFVAITLQPTSDLEAQVLEIALQALSYRLLDEVPCPSALHQVLSYHYAYHKNELQFLNYRELGRIFNDVHSLVQTEFVVHTDESLQPLDLFAADLLLRKITPAPVTDKKFWDLQYLRDVYVKNLRECQGILERILRGPAVTPLQVEVRHRWQKIRAVQMYIEHMILPLPDNGELRKGAFRLWKFLEHVSSFKAKESVACLLTILRAVDDCVAKSFKLMTTAVRQAAAKTTFGSEGYGAFCRAVKMLFLEVVSVLCFGQGSYEPPTPELIEVLMNQIFKKEQVTQDLTPLPWEEPDSSPVVRSVLLQLILMGSTHNEVFEAMDEKQETMVTRFMDTSLKYLHGASEDGLYTMVVRCLEDAAFKIWIADQRSKDISRSLETLGHIVESAIQVYVRHDPARPVTYRWLRSIAHLRFALGLFGDMLSSYVADTPDKLPLTARNSKMLGELVEFLSPLLLRENLQELSLYLAKHLARRHGMKILRCLYNQGHRFVLPRALHQQMFQKPSATFISEASSASETSAIVNLLASTLNHSPDYFVLCGGEYLEMREALTQSIVDESVDHFQQHIQELPALQAPLLLMVLFSKLAWPSGSSCSPNEEFVEEVSSACQRICNIEPEMVGISMNLLDRNISGRSRIMQPSQNPSDRMLTALVLHVVSTVLSKKNDPLMQPFVSILTNPQALMYLPTMPEDNLVEAMNTIPEAKFYACPNGHPYAIGDCTRPIVQAMCKTCGAGIGGLNHRLQAGNYELQSVKRRETGYLLGPASTRSEAIPERSLSPLACAVMRFILHACFMWSACHQSEPCAEEESIKAIRTALVTNVTDLASFFWDHLKKDLRIIGKCLPRGENEVIIVLHRIVQHLAGMQPTTGVDGSMVSNANRKAWEDEFQRLALAPSLQSVDTLIQDSLDRMADDNEHDEVFLAVYERSRKEPDMTQTLWAFRARISLENLSRVFISIPNAKTLHPLLHTFLHEEPILKALQYLPDIIKLQRTLTRHFNLNIDRNEGQTQFTIRSAIAEATMPSVDAVERSTLHDCVDSFRQAWKLVKEMLPNHNVACVDFKLAITNDAQNKNISDVASSQDMRAITNDDVQRMGEISEHLPVAYLLPCTSGPGLCSLVLSDFLSRQQNKLLEFCSKQKAFSGFYKTSVPLVKVQPFHMVSYEGEIDSVILTHCQYSLSFGKGQEVEYDFAAIEKHIYDRFLVTKPEIDRRSQPLMVYTSDIIRRGVFQQLKEKLKPQVALSSEEQKEVLLRLHRDLRSIQEALRVVTTAMGFLAGEGGRLDMPLSQYLLKVLRLRKTEFCGRCTLQHILSLWETLALEKVRMHSLNGMKVPFDGYDQSMVELFKDMLPEVKVQFDVKKYPLNPLMKLLFHFIQVRLRMLEPGQFEWPLKDCLPHCDSNVEELDVDWVDDLPDDILVEHAVHVWHITVRHQAQLLQEGRAY